MDDEIVYFLRILLLIFNGGMVVCKGVLDKELLKENVSLDEILHGKEILKPKLIKSQRKILFGNNSVNTEDLDLSLLIVVLLDFMDLSLEKKEHIKIIKEKRNEIIHSGKVTLDKDTYQRMEKSLKTSLSKLAEKLPGEIQTELSDIIKKFLTEPFGKQAALKYVDVIKNEEEILQWVYGKVEELVGEITTPECRLIENMKRGQDVLDKLIKTLQELNEDNISLNGARKSKNSDSTADVLCMKCLEDHILNAAVVFCGTCNSYLCEECNKLLHVKSLKLSMKNHHIRGAKAAAEKVDMKGMDICHIHNEPVIFVCKSHDELCCGKCKNSSHSTCKQLDETGKVAKHSYNFELHPVAEIEQLQRQIEDMMNWMLSVEEKTKKQFQKLPLTLQEKRTRVLDAFDKKAEMLESNAKIIHDEKIKTISRNRSQFEDLNLKSDQAKISLKLIEASGTASDRFIARHYLNKQFKSFVKTFDDIKIIHESANELEDFSSIENVTDYYKELSLNVEN